MFAMLYFFLGVDIGGHPDTNHGDGNDYENFPSFTGYFFWSYRAAIGDIDAPNASAWDN